MIHGLDTGFLLGYVDSYMSARANIERSAVFCEGLGAWCIACGYHQAKTFWTLRTSGLGYGSDPDPLAALRVTAQRLLGLIRGQLC